MEEVLSSPINNHHFIIIYFSFTKHSTSCPHNTKPSSIYSKTSGQLETFRTTDDEEDYVHPSFSFLKTRKYSIRIFPWPGRSPGKRKILIDLRLREVMRVTSRVQIRIPLDFRRKVIFLFFLESVRGERGDSRDQGSKRRLCLQHKAIFGANEWCPNKLCKKAGKKRNKADWTTFKHPSSKR